MGAVRASGSVPLRRPIFIVVSVPLASCWHQCARLMPLCLATLRELVHVLQILAATPVGMFQIYAFWYVILAARRSDVVLAVQIAGLVVKFC